MDIYSYDTLCPAANARDSENAETLSCGSPRPFMIVSQWKMASLEQRVEVFTSIEMKASLASGFTTLIRHFQS